MERCRRDEQIERSFLDRPPLKGLHNDLDARVCAQFLPRDCRQVRAQFDARNPVAAPRKGQGRLPRATANLQDAVHPKDAIGRKVREGDDIFKECVRIAWAHPIIEHGILIERDAPLFAFCLHHHHSVLSLRQPLAIESIHFFPRGQRGLRAETGAGQRARAVGIAHRLAQGEPPI